MTEAIRMENLCKSYSGRPVLKGISLCVSRGETFALLGVNGAGKTTALECMEGLRRYDSGSLLVNGSRGIQLQSASLPVHLRAGEAVRLFAKWRGAQPDPALLAALGIDGMWKTTYGRLSTGQKRRLHLALALLGDPEILFLDEPTAGLDVEGRRALHDRIRSLKTAGRTIILASHDMAEVESLCDRIAILDGGHILFCGTPDELTKRLGRRYVLHIQTTRGEEEYTSDAVGDTLLTVLEGYRRQGIGVLDIRIDRGTLEQHFLELTGRRER